MTEIELLTKQTKDAYHWTNKLLNDISDDKWDIIPEIIETNLTWQTGHLIMSFYYHTVMVTVGHQRDIFENMPLKTYGELFSFGKPEGTIGQTNPSDLKTHLEIMQDKSIDVIKSLSNSDLKSDLEPTKMKHPVANNKFEALDWNIKHTMWHCGQISTLKRVLGVGYQFIPKPS